MHTELSEALPIIQTINSIASHAEMLIITMFDICLSVQTAYQCTQRISHVCKTEVNTSKAAIPRATPASRTALSLISFSNALKQPLTLYRQHKTHTSMQYLHRQLCFQQLIQILLMLFSFQKVQFFFFFCSLWPCNISYFTVDSFVSLCCP